MLLIFLALKVLLPNLADFLALKVMLPVVVDFVGIFISIVFRSCSIYFHVHVVVSFRFSFCFSSHVFDDSDVRDIVLKESSRSQNFGKIWGLIVKSLGCLLAICIALYLVVLSS